MKRILFLILAFFLLICDAVLPQSFILPGDNLINGYADKIAGLDFEYHSCIPGLRESLLLRASSGKDFIEWQTDSVPATLENKTASFIWVAALGSSPGRARMDLSINGQQAFTFYTDGRPSWTLKNDTGSSLSFNSIMVDQFGDNHGYMILRIPAGQLTPGKPLVLRVTGGRNNLTSWYMTFKKVVKTGVTMNAFPAIIKKGDAQLQLVEAGIFYFGKEAEGKIYADNKLIENTVLKFGYNNVNLGLPPVTVPTEVKLKVVAGNFEVNNTVTLNPVRKWTIRFIQHTHTDIGYTRSQTDILAEHLRYLDYALDYCDATDDYPDNAKFRWTCEASWPVDEYLRCRPASQVERLMKRIREGRIEVTGMYFNFDEIPDENILASSLAALKRIKEKGIPVSLAMQDDVNGIGWCLNDYFSQTGVKYLNMGTHGHRALIAFDIPTMFWWESPSGKRMLTFRAEHYMTGNTVLEMQTGDINRFKNNLLNYLIRLEAKHYPWNEMAIQHSGYLTDNSPPSTIACDLIRQWNDLFVWPKLTTSTAESFFSDMEHDHGTEFQVIRGAWPDWWTDGFGASARETAVTRVASSTLAANEVGLSMAAISGVKLPDNITSDISLTDNALLFYTEHTMGYSESVREPLSEPTMRQRAMKESYAWEANRRAASIGEEAMGLLQSTFNNDSLPSLIVFNTLNWKRSGLAMVYIDHQIVPPGKTAGIFDPEGHRLAVQPVQSRSDVTQWAIWMENIPAFGYKKYIIKALDEAPLIPEKELTKTIENKWYRITINPEKGTISSLFDKDLSLELLDQKSRYNMGEFILEQLGNRSQMESRKLNDYKRSPLDTVWFDSMSHGNIWSSVRFYGESSTTVKPKGFMFEIRLYNNEKRLDLAYSIVKKEIVNPESFYIAFPFGIKDGKHFTELQGGVIETGKDQIKGSSNDWYTVQNFTAVRNSTMQAVLGSAEMPLMQFGAINTGRYIAGAMPQSTSLFSWPMNNYWVTNFNADQRGGISWTYYLTTSSDNSNLFASRFGWGCRTPFLTRVLPASSKDDIKKGKKEGSYITGWPENVVLISAIPDPDGKSCVIHLRETDERNAPVKLFSGINGKPLKTQEVNVFGDPVTDPSLELKPLESKFYRLYFNR
jgi:alpha-mannosidase